MAQPKKDRTGIGGRPSYFNDAVQNTIVSLLQEGKTAGEIADILGVARQSIWAWKRKHPEFLTQVQDAKEMATDLVEASLFQKAIGWQHEEEIAFFDKETGSVIKDKITKKFPASDDAAIYWLKCHRPERYKENIQVPQQNLLLMQTIINNAIQANPENNRIISDVIGEKRIDGDDELPEAATDSEVGEK